MDINEKSIKKMLKKLKKGLPTDKPVKLKFVQQEKMKNCWGFCVNYKSHYLIKLCKADFHVMVYTLLHEYAHALKFTDDFHSKEWGKAYAKVWKYYENHCL